MKTLLGSIYLSSILITLHLAFATVIHISIAMPYWKLGTTLKPTLLIKIKKENIR